MYAFVKEFLVKCCIFLVVKNEYLSHCAEYTIDDTKGYGRMFDGIGGISGGGATSKLLVNYPEQQRNEILDYLFKPNYGASLHILKVEIGGDAQSSDGTEASHMHDSWDENYQRGYEWWLMTEAKKRNPDILLYGLPWSFPAWVGAGTLSPYTDPNRTADYIVRWIKGAKEHHNLTIDLVGIWNEKSYDITYIKTLRKWLDEQQLNHIRIVASDNKWAIAGDILQDPDLASAIDYIGVHYPGTLSTDTAIQTTKQLWSSEDYSTFNDNTGGGCWARILNQNYVNGQMSATISWNLIAAYYDNLSWTRDGLMTAMQPWSGHYSIQSPIWVSAHTAQFSRPGWYYLRHGSGVGKLGKGGSYVTFVDKSSGNLTVVIETMSHDHSICIRPFLPEYTIEPQNITLELKGNFSKVSVLNVWYTKLGFGAEPSTNFKKLKPIQVKNGTVELQLGVDELYTLTTLTSGTKGSASVPPVPKPFPLPYRDNFELYSEFEEPYNFAQQTGCYEVRKSTDAGRSQILRQVLLEGPINWCPHITLPFPITVIGNSDWLDIYVEVDARTGYINESDSVFVAARVDQGGCQVFAAHGFYFFLFPQEGTYELSNDLARAQSLLKGSVSLNTTWNNLGLLVQGFSIIGTLNGNQLFNFTSTNKPPAGFVAIGSSSFGIADFDNVKIMSSKDGLSRMQKTFHIYKRDKNTLYFKPSL